MNQTDASSDRTQREDGVETSAALHRRWERALMRHPKLSLPGLRKGMSASDPAAARAALLGAFFVLERWGRGDELQDALQSALQTVRREAGQAEALHEAAALSEALGRLHYQHGDYVQACQAWSATLDWADDDSRPACQARIGLAHLCYALGEWARGGRVLDQAELHYVRLPQDPYLRAKIALNRAASLRATQGPQAARGVLEDALAAAREAGHADYQAEALWHQARCARDSGDSAFALALAFRVLDQSQRCGYRWLHAQAVLLLSEVHSGEAALGWAGQALSLAETLQSRHLQAAAHGRMAELMREQGELGPSWHHQQQRQRLESTLNQSQLPSQLETLARFDTDPHGADALLLSLATQPWPLDDLKAFQRQWLALRPRLCEVLGLSKLAFQWSRLPELAGEALAEAGAGWLSLDLQIDGDTVGQLRLGRAARSPWPRADAQRAQRLAAWLQEVMTRMEHHLQREEAQALDRDQLQALDQLLAAHLQSLTRALTPTAPSLAERQALLAQVVALQRFRASAADTVTARFPWLTVLNEVAAAHAPLLQAQGCELELNCPAEVQVTQVRGHAVLLCAAVIRWALSRGARRFRLDAVVEGERLCLRCREGRGQAVPEDLGLLRGHARALGGVLLAHGAGLDILLPLQAAGARALPASGPARDAKAAERVA